MPFRTTTGLTAAPVEVRAYVKRRISAEEGFDEQYRLLFGSFVDAGGAFDYYEAEPVSWSATATAPLDVAATVDGAVWLAVLRPTPPWKSPTPETCSVGRYSPSASCPT